MKNNYEELFKFEHSKKDFNLYFVYRKNLFGNYKLFASAKIVTSDIVSINFAKNVSQYEQLYIERYFSDIINLKIECQKGNKFNYIVYCRNSDGNYEKAAMVIVYYNSYEMIAIKPLLPNQIEYLSNYFKYLMQ